MTTKAVRRLLLVFGDQLTDESALFDGFDGFDAEQDAVLVVEAREEATVVRQHKHRLVLFLSAMRHFRDALRGRGIRVFYSAIDEPGNRGTFGEEIPRRLRAIDAARLVVREPGDERVRAALVAAPADSPTELDIVADDHFLCGTDDFSRFADERTTLTLEHFYRWMRRRHDIMLEHGKPAGGRWNFDRDNRRTFGATGPPPIPSPCAFAHHIQRLMVLGLFALLLGVRPREFNDWHMAMSIDAIDWVSAPNVIGMSQYADGGLFATKPYCASGRYIKRMSNYCADCRFNPDKTTGDDACPFNTLYWDFLSRNRNRLRNNNRLKLQFAHLDNKDGGEQRAIRRDAERLRSLLIA